MHGAEGSRGEPEQGTGQRRSERSVPSPAAARPWWAPIPTPGGLASESHVGRCPAAALTAWRRLAASPENEPGFGRGPDEVGRLAALRARLVLGQHGHPLGCGSGSELTRRVPWRAVEPAAVRCSTCARPGTCECSALGNAIRLDLHTPPGLYRTDATPATERARTLTRAPSRWHI